MLFKKPLKTFLFPAANILLACLMLWAFFIADLSVVRTFSVAHMNSLRLLKPNSMDYFWKLNIHDEPINKSCIRFYTDFYEHLLQVFPCLRDAYGILGYCYHYLGDDAKAIDYLKKAIAYNPLYSWNYYNLAVIYVSESRYQEALALLEELEALDPQESLRRMFSSEYVYTPLLEPGKKEAIGAVAGHLKLSYRVSYDLIQLLSKASNKEVEKIIKKMKLEAYAF